VCVKTLFTVVVSYHKRAAAVACTVVTASHYLVNMVAFSTALGPMLAFQKHCTRSNTDMLKMRAGPSYICMGFAVFLKATTVVAHLALRAPGNPAEESVARRLAWISMD
jgi:hypothetical protein